jgi:hypothetical protein
MVNKNINKPSYRLADIKRAFNEPKKLVMTASARRTAFGLGFSEQDIVDAIQALTSKNFYKSMIPVNPGFTAWQDVYKPAFKDIELYIKFQVNNKKELILSFKEK